MFAGFSKLHRNHQQIAHGMIVVGALVLSVKFIAAAKEMAMAWRYGVSGEVDAYLLALAITTWLPVILSSVSLVVFIPRLAALNEIERRLYIGELNLIYALLAVGVFGLTVLVGPSVAAWIASDLKSETIELARMAVIWLSPISAFIVFIGYFSLRLQSRRKFGYTLYEAMPALFILLLVLTLPGHTGIAPVLWGTVIGFGIQTLVLTGMTHRADGSVGHLSLPNFASPAWYGIAGAIGVMLMSQLINGLNTPIDQVFAARVGDNAIATLGYANRVIALATALGATVIARAALPVFSAAAISEAADTARRQALTWAALMLVAGAAAAFIGWNLSEFVVGLLFERGAFGASDTERVGSVLRIALLQLPFYFPYVLLIQWLAAAKRLDLVFWSTIFGIGAKLGALWLFSEEGIFAIPLSTAVFYAVASLVVVIVTRRLSA